MKRALILQLVLLSWAGSLARAQGNENVSPPVFVERIDVNIVNVEVFVTDSQGRHVFGLTKDDFEITEDGRPVEITNFFTVEREDRLTRILEGEAGPGRRAGGRTSAARRPVPVDQQLSLIVYIDNFSLKPGNRKRVLKELRGFLDERAFQGDNVMIVTHNRKLEVVLPFTREREPILRALDKIGKYAAGGNAEEFLRRATIEEMLDAQQDDDPGRAEIAVKSYADSARDDVRRSARALQLTLRSLAGLPGRKAILHVSGGLQNTPGEELYVLYADLFGRDEQVNFDRYADSEVELFKTVAREANAQRVTIYTLDARGGLGSGGLTADYGGLGLVVSASISTLDTIRDFNLEAPLVEMAEQTGGTALLNSFNVKEALARVGRDFEMFYSLGYASPGGGDGEYHNIKVTTKHKGLKARNRSGYVDKPVVEQVADRTLASLLLDTRQNPLDVRLAFGEPEKRGRNTYILPVIIRIPLRGVLLLPNDATREGRLQIFLALQDESGNLSEIHRFPLPVSLPLQATGDLADPEIGYRTNLKVKRGTPKIAVGVWDEISGTESFVSEHVLVGQERRPGRRPRRGP